MSPASARAVKDWNDRIQKARWNLPRETETNAVHVQDQTRDLVQRPSTGRNTKMGRRVEKPQDPKAGGPSGQTENARHNKRHANK